MAERPFLFTSVVRRVVLDNLRFTVRASNPEEARDKAKKFLSEYPEATEVEGIDYAYIDNRENMDVEVLHLDFVKGKPF